MKSIKKITVLILVFAVVIVSSVATGASSFDKVDSREVLTKEYFMKNKIDRNVDIEAWEEVVIHKKNNTDAYDYPVRGGSEEWKALKNHQNRIEACRIPESKLRNMSTAGLAISVLNYPLFFDVYFFDTPQEGLEVITSRFNGLQELMKREDAGVELIKIYRSMDPLATKEKWSSMQKRAHATTIKNIELLLSNKNIIGNLNEVQLKELSDEAMKKYKAKLSLNQSNYNLSFSTHVMEQTTDAEMKPSEDYFETYDINPGNDPFAKHYTIKTPAGTDVDVKTYYDDISQETAEEYLDFVAIYHPDAIVLGTPKNRYNCHSYAWYEQSTTNTYWMDDPTAYMMDGSYDLQGTQAVEDSKAYYVNGDHSAIAYNYFDPSDYDTVWCVSKWGSGALVGHMASDCPYNYSTIEFYK